MLNLHSGGELIEFDALRQLVTPPATATHVPLPHYDLVNMVKYALGYFQHEVVEEHHAIDKDGMRYFGLLTLRSNYGPYTDTVGLRNSSDKSFPIGIAFGSRVFVCSNLSFHGDHVIKRKHTLNSKRDLPGLIAGVVEPLRLQREAQHRMLTLYQDTPLTDALVDHAIMQCYRQDVLNVTRIADVLEQYENPTHDWGEKTIWRLFNAVTFSLNGKVAENPLLTTKLHRILDAVAETVH